MALSKKIQNENGIVTSYHKIVALHVVVNNTIVIEIASYLDDKQRDIEKDAFAAAQNEEEFVCNVFIDGSVENMPYSETESVVTAYNFLKTLDKYKDAIDV